MESIPQHQIALCVGVDNESSSVQLIYLDDLESIEIRKKFTGAEFGQCYRMEMKTKGKVWEQVQCLLKKRIMGLGHQFNNNPSNEILQLQLSLPIVFSPDFSPFGWTLIEQNGNLKKFYSTKLSSGGTVKCELNDNPPSFCQIYSAYLTLDKKNGRPPGWILESIENILMGHNPQLPAPAFSNPIHFGIVLKLAPSAGDNSCLAVLLGSNDELRFARISKPILCGDRVTFTATIAIDCFVQPLKMVLNCHKVIGYNSLGTPSVRSIDGHDIFELRFKMGEQMLNPAGGTFRVEGLGNVMDLDGKLARLSRTVPVGQIVVIRARLCIVPEQPHPLWALIEARREVKSEARDEEEGGGQQQQQNVGEMEQREEQQQQGTPTPTTSSEESETAAGINNSNMHDNTSITNARTTPAVRVDSPASTRSTTSTVPIATSQQIKSEPADPTAACSSSSLNQQSQPPQPAVREGQGVIVLLLRTKGNIMHVVCYDVAQRMFIWRDLLGFEPNFDRTGSLQPGAWLRINFRGHTVSRFERIPIRYYGCTTNLPVLNPSNAQLWDELENGRLSQIRLEHTGIDETREQQTQQQPREEESSSPALNQISFDEEEPPSTPRPPSPIAQRVLRSRTKKNVQQQQGNDGASPSTSAGSSGTGPRATPNARRTPATGKKRPPVKRKSPDTPAGAGRGGDDEDPPAARRRDDSPDDEQDDPVALVAMHKLRNEWDQVVGDPELRNYGTARPEPENMLHWVMTITGPAGSPYEGGQFRVRIEYTAQYPFQPPRVTFATPIFHPNIDTGTGTISMDILSDGWSPEFTISSLLIALFSLLSNPDLGSAISPEAYESYTTDQPRFQEIAAEWTREHAMGDK